MIKDPLRELLLQVAEELKKVMVDEAFWDPPAKSITNMAAMNSRTWVERYRQYATWEKDPVYRDIFGEILRLRTILNCTDFEWRQRDGWGDWFIAVYRANNRWNERAELVREDPDPYAATIYRPDNWAHPYEGLRREIIPEKVAEKLKRIQEEDKRKEEVKDDGTT